MRRTLWGAVAVGVALAIALPAVTASAAAEPPVTVKIAVIADTSGPLAVLDDFEAGVKAAAKAIEASTHVKFDISTCDGKFDPNTTAACARSAVEDNVAAVFALSLFDGAQVLPVLEQADIPAFWGASTSAGEDTNPLSMFPTSGTTGGWGALGAGAGLNKFKNCVILRPDIIKDAAKLVSATYEAEGGKVKAELSAPFVIPGAANPPDKAPYAAAVKAENPGCVILMGLEASWVQPIVEAGITAPIVIGDGGSEANEVLAALPSESTKNLYKGGGAPPFDAVKVIPAVKQFRKELKAVGVDDPNAAALFAWIPWNGMYALAAIAEGLSGTVDGPALLAAINSADPIELPSGQVWDPSAVGPPGNERNSNAIGYFSKYVGDGKWKPVKPPGAKGVPIDSDSFS